MLRFIFLLAFTFLAKTSLAKIRLGNSATTTVSGKLQISVEDPFRGPPRTLYFLETDHGRISLEFKSLSSEGLATGMQIEVSGKFLGNRAAAELQVESLRLLESRPLTRQIWQGEQKVLTVMVSLSDAAVALTQEQMTDLMFSETNPSVSGLYRESSWGKMWMSGTVVGPFTVQYANADGYPSNWLGMVESQAKTLAQNAGVDFTGYDHITYIFPKAVPLCGLGGIGGNPGISWIGGGCLGAQAIAHELGHNMLLGHSGADRNNDGAAEDQYADVSDPMGYASDVKQFFVVNKIRMHWLADVTNLASSGAYRVMASEFDPANAPNPIGYKIPIPGTNDAYYFSYRKRIGYDSQLGGRYVGRLQIHRANIVDYSTTRFLSSLGDGESFVDPAVGFTVRQDTHDDDGSNFTLNFISERLPSPWRSSDIETSLGGSTVYDSGGFIVQSTGTDIWNKSDSFHFNYFPLTGDADIVAHVQSQQNTDPWARAGVMIRSSLDAKSANVFFGATAGHGLVFQARREANTNTATSNTAPAASWLRLVRAGDLFSAYQSSDGQTWKLVGSITLNLPPAIFIGTASASHKETTFNTTIFDNVSWSGNATPLSGGLWRDIFREVPANNVSQLSLTPYFPNFPSPASGVIAAAESPSNFSDHYGERWTGWLVAPETGDYQFFLASDDESQLWLSTSESSLDKIKILDNAHAIQPRQWSKGVSSVPIALVAAKKYYVELLHKDGSGPDNCAFTWKKPSDTTAPADGSDPIAGANFEYLPGGLRSVSKVRRPDPSR